MAAAVEIIEPKISSEPPRIRAAQYVRMSTDHQRYSTENQADAIAAYADIHNMDIVATYADEGKSGLNIAGRESLQRLAYLSPELIQLILDGRQPRSVTLKRLTAAPLPFDWAEQRRHFATVC